MKVTKNKIALIKQNSRNTMPTMRTVTKVKQSKKVYKRRDGKSVSQF
jgi:hypothetical protein